jgi:hypothetical protein
MSQQTKNQLTVLLNTNITDALNKQNTASKVREVIQSTIDSLGILSGSNSFVGDQTITGSVILPDVLSASYINNSSALEAGVPVGALYRNGNTILMATPATNPSQSAYTTTVRGIYPSASLVETWGTYTVNYIKQKSGFDPYQILYAVGICADDVDAFSVNGNLGQFPVAMNSFLGPFMAGGLAGYPFVGSIGFGAFASHITDTGSLLISCTPHIGVTIDGDAGYQYRKGQTLNIINQTPSTNCGAVHGAVGLVISDPLPPSQSNAPYDNENYELWKLADIIYPYSASFSGSTSENIVYATSLIREAGWQYVYNNSSSFSSSLAGRTMYAIGGTFINTDYDFEGYIEVNQFQAYNSSTNSWEDFTQDYVSGLMAQG